jgi:hypothetical protein
MGSKKRMGIFYIRLKETGLGMKLSTDLIKSQEKLPFLRFLSHSVIREK